MDTVDPLSALHGNPHDRDLAPSRIPVPIQHGMRALFLVAIVVATAFLLTEHWRRATFLLGLALVWLSVTRATCDSRILGVLAVRSRVFDALFTLVVGAMLMFLSASVDALGS